MTNQKKAGILSLGRGKRLSCALSLTLMLAALLLPSSAKADVAWAEFDSNTKTLTFKCGAQKPSNSTATVYDLNTGERAPGWYNNACTSVVFEKSFSDARPTTCFNWFGGQSALTSISGLENLNTEDVTDMGYMFSECSSLQGDLNLSGFNTANVKSMRSMFAGCSALKGIGLSSFNTASVTNMSSMFETCSSLESLDLASFNTASVTRMDYMFEGCESLTILDLSAFNTAKVTKTGSMFASCTNLNTIYVSDEFNVSSVESSDLMFSACVSLAGAKPYDATKVGAAMATTDGYLSKKEAWAEFDSSTKTLTFKYGKKTSVGETVTVYALNDGSDSPDWSGETITSVVFDPSFSEARPTTCYEWFNAQHSLANITGLKYLNTEKVTNMYSMFYSCSGLDALDLSTFNTANVTNMNYMFANDTKLKDLKLSGFNTASVTSMNSMFEACSALESLDVSSFNTANVASMNGMFMKCSSLKSLDLSSFSTANLKNTNNMFSYCDALTTIYVSDKFDLTNTSYHSYMFEDCNNLVGAVAFSSGSTNGTMANYNTGYFKTYYKVGDTKHELCGKTLSVDNLVLEGDEDLVVLAPFTAANVSFSRYMYSKWGTLCVPFEVDATNIDGTKFYALKSVSADMITLTQLEDKIPAGTPMLVNSTDGDGNAADISISASSVEVGKAPADGTQADGGQLVGSFAETEVPDNGYIISKNKFWLVSDLKKNTTATAVKTKAMRAWLKPGAENAEAKAHVLSIALDDENETTAVDAIEALTEDTAEIYDLQGRRLNSLQKGLNIVKTGNVTRKIMVK
jgi:surface protein